MLSEVTEVELAGRKFAYVTYDLESKGLVVTTAAPDGRRIAGQFTIRGDITDEEMISVFADVTATVAVTHKEDTTVDSLVEQQALSGQRTFGNDGEVKSTSKLSLEAGSIEFSVPDGFVSTFVSAIDAPENESGTFTTEFFDKKGTEYCNVTCQLIAETLPAKDLIEGDSGDVEGFRTTFIELNEKEINGRPVYYYGSYSEDNGDKLYTLIAACDVGDCVFRCEMVTDNKDLMMFSTIEDFFK